MTSAVQKSAVGCTIQSNSANLEAIGLKLKTPYWSWSFKKQINKKKTNPASDIASSIYERSVIEL